MQKLFKFKCMHGDAYEGEKDADMTFSYSEFRVTHILNTAVLVCFSFRSKGQLITSYKP